MSEGWAIDIFNFMVAILCLCYSNVATQVLIWTLDLLQSSKVFSKIKSSKTKPHEFIFWFKKKNVTMLRITGIFYQKLLHKITIKKIKIFRKQNNQLIRHFHSVQIDKTVSHIPLCCKFSILQQNFSSIMHAHIKNKNVLVQRLHSFLDIIWYNNKKCVSKKLSNYDNSLHILLYSIFAKLWSMY